MRQPPRSGWTTTIVLAVLLLVGGGGVSAYLLLRKADGPGAADPRSAVTGSWRPSTPSGTPAGGRAGLPGRPEPGPHHQEDRRDIGS